jgi:hypothetical protein
MGLWNNLRRDHRRSEVEARAHLDGTNGRGVVWNTEGRKKGTSLPLVPAKPI